MIDMASRNVLPVEQTSPVITTNPHMLSYQNSVEMNPAQAEHLFRNREMARSNSIEWLERGRNQASRSLPPDILKQHDWVARTREYEIQLERDAYYHASQEYIRLMKEDQNRQSFREKQRLTEDLEKQKRLLIEDLARDQQLRQDQFKRRFSVGSDVRAMHMENKNDRHQVLRGCPMPYDIRVMPNNQIHSALDVRYPTPLAGPKDLYAFRRMPEANCISGNSFPITGKDVNNSKQCVHSNLNNGSLIPIIQEKEQQIKEMEEKLIKLRGDRSFSKSIAKVVSEMHPPFIFDRKVEAEEKSNVIIINKSQEKINDCSSPIDDLIIDVEAKEDMNVSTEVKTEPVARSDSKSDTENMEVVSDRCSKVKNVDEMSIQEKDDEVKEYATVKVQSGSKDDDLQSPGNNIDNESGQQNPQAKYSKKQRNKQKAIQNRKEETPNTNFLAIQNRIAMDLIGHNWLVMKIDAEEVSVKKKTHTTVTTKVEVKEEIDESEVSNGVNNNKIKISQDISTHDASQSENISTHDAPQSEESLENAELNVKEQIPEVKNMGDTIIVIDEKKTEDDSGNKGDEINESKDDQQLKTCIIQNEKKAKNTPFLSTFLNPKKPNPQLSSPKRINPPLPTASTKQQQQQQQQLLPKDTIISPVSPPVLVRTPPKEMVKGVSTRAVTSNQIQSSSKITYPSEGFGNGPPLLISEGKTSLDTESSKSGFINPPSSLDNKLQQSHAYLPRSETLDRETSFRPNLVVMTRNETNNAQHEMRFPSNYPHPHTAGQQMPYSKMIVEERYNRKRPHGVDEKTLMLNLERNSQIRHSLDRRMSELQKTPEDRSNSRIFVSSVPPTAFGQDTQENQLPYAAKQDARVPADFSHLSRFSESPLFEQSLYKVGGMTAQTRVKSTDILDAQSHFLKRRDTPSSLLCPTASIEERSLEKNIGRFGILDARQDLETKLENHLRQYVRQDPTHGNAMHQQLSLQHSRENRYISENQRSEIGRKQNIYSCSSNGQKMLADSFLNQQLMIHMGSSMKEFELLKI